MKKINFVLGTMTFGESLFGSDTENMIEAFGNLGYTELANEIAENYKTSICKYGFSENTSAITGKGLRCKGYAWAANAYQVL